MQDYLNAPQGALYGPKNLDGRLILPCPTTCKAHMLRRTAHRQILTMPLRQLDTATGLVYQVTGSEEAPAAVYLPGVHGDWTPNQGARRILSADSRLIEVAYPRMERWQLSDFAISVEELLDTLGVHSAHLIGESFGSLVAWEMGLSRPERVRSLLLVGGFTQPPVRGLARSAKFALSCLPTAVLEKSIDAYVFYKDRKGEQRLGRKQGVEPYSAVRTRRGKRATANRMRIIEHTDIRDRLHGITHPVRYIGGETDLIIQVQRELATLERHLPKHCEFESHLIEGGPHAVIASHPQRTAETLAHWIYEIEQSPQAFS